jgi:hypothetical protein
MLDTNISIIVAICVASELYHENSTNFHKRSQPGRTFALELAVLGHERLCQKASGYSRAHPKGRSPDVSHQQPRLFQPRLHGHSGTARTAGEG